MPTENRSISAGLPGDQLPPCAEDVFKSGVSVCLVGDVPKHAAEKICQSLSAVTGWKIDWHYIGGRTHIKALAPAEQPKGEPIQLTAVATLVDDADGGLEASWLLEGGTAELFAGMTLLVAENAPELCLEDGGARVYIHADPSEVERLRNATAFVQRLVNCAGSQQSVAAGYMRDILDVLKGNPVPSAPVERDEMTAMVDAAMVEMANIHPPLKRSECERLIRAALERKQ